MRFSELIVPAPEHPAQLRRAGSALLIHFWLTLATYTAGLLYSPELKAFFDTIPGISAILWATLVIIMVSHLYLIFRVLARKNWARWMVAIMTLIACISAVSSIFDFSTAPLTNILNLVGFGLTAFATKILFTDPVTVALFSRNSA